MTLTPRPPDHSHTTMTEYVLPVHANAFGNVFGGQVLAWVDLCAAICAERHTSSICITAGLDQVSFEEPIKVGQVVRLRARVTAAFRTSLEIQVKVEGEDPIAGRIWPCVSAFITFVAVDASLKPTLVHPLATTSDEERLRETEAHARRERRLLERKR